MGPPHWLGGGCWNVGRDFSGRSRHQALEQALKLANPKALLRIYVNPDFFHGQLHCHGGLPVALLSGALLG
jgi:hypothetical protein